MSHQISDKTIIRLVIISTIINILIVIGMIMNAKYFDDNCWNNYDTLDQAEINCRGE